jgi:hypothetical protein
MENWRHLGSRERRRGRGRDRCTRRKTEKKRK